MTTRSTLAKLDRMRTLSDVVFTRDGAGLLATLRWLKRDADKEHSCHVWRFDLDGMATQLSDGDCHDSMAQQSPLDDRVAFLSDRICNGKRALYMLDENMLDEMQSPKPLNDIPCSIEVFQWSADGTYIVALGADRGLNGGATHGAKRLCWDAEDDPEVSVAGAARRRLFRFFPAEGRVEEISLPDLTVWEFALLPDGVIAVVSADASERGWHHAHLVRIDFCGGEAQTIYKPAWQIQGLTVCPKGARVAFLEGWSSDRGLVAGVATVVDLVSGELSILAAEHQSNITMLRWRDEFHLWFAGWERLGSVYGLITCDGQLVWQIHDEGNLSENSFRAQVVPAADGSGIAAVRDTVAVPQELVWKANHADAWATITALNVGLARDFPDYPEIRHIRWAAQDGLELEALALLPKSQTPGTLPMIVDIHGGPSMASKLSFNPGGALAYAAAGYAVFLPNYRGNVGWGQVFARMNLGDPAGAEFDDIMAGVDACIAEGFADPDRLGVTGASYGGYLTNWAVAQTHRFKAAVAISSISNQLSCHYSCEHDFHEFINGGSLMQAANLEIALARSPLLRLEQPDTPTLLIQGKEDRCTPLGQAQEFHAALRERGVATELVVYPREGHQLSERAHKHDAWQRKLTWFDRYLRTA